jgi:hypothetical protein
LLIDRENLVESDEIGNGEDDIETADCADFFLINHIGRGAEGFAGNGENGVEIADYESFFFANHADRGAEGFAEDGEIGDDKDGVGTANCENFFINHANRCAVSLYSANLVIVIAAVKIASIYRFWICRINSGSFFINYS